MNKKFTKLIAALALLVFMTPSLVGWGQETATVSASKPSSQTSWNWTDDHGNTWSANVTWKTSAPSNPTNMNSGYYQIGTSSNPATSVEFSTSGITGTITQIVVNCASYQGNGSVSCTVNNSAFGTQSQSIPTWSSNSGGDVTFFNTNGATGAIKVIMTNNNSSGRAMYIKSIAVTYTVGSITYTVTYNGNGADGGTTPVDNNVYQNGETVTVLANTFTKTGHTFEWWSDMEDGTDEDANLYEEDDTFEITENTTLYAQWSPNQYNVAIAEVDDVDLYAEYGSNSMLVEGENANINYGTQITLSYDGLASGHAFDSWVIKNAQNEVVTSQVLSGNTLTVPDYAITVSASLRTLQQYTITFDAGSGSCATASMPCYEGSSIELPTATPSQDCASRGWTFAGWATASVNETQTAPTLLTGSYTPSGSTTLYAVYKVTEGDGGEQEFDFPAIALANGWENGVAYTEVTIGQVTIEALGDGNNGKWYTTGSGSWRMYSGGTVEISADNYAVTAVTSTPTCEFTISNGIATFSPSARTDFTNITVTYGSSTITYNSNPSCLPMVATPTFTPAAGTYTGAQNVTINCTTEDASILYKTSENGEWQTYSNAIPVSTTTTIWAKATKDGMDDSEVAEATYTIQYTLTDGIENVTDYSLFDYHDEIWDDITPDENGHALVSSGAEVRISGGLAEECYTLQGFYVVYGNNDTIEATYITEDGDNYYSFRMPASDAMLKAKTNQLPQHTLTIGTLSHVTLDLTAGEESDEVQSGDALCEGKHVTVIATPAAGYVMESVSVVDENNQSVEVTYQGTNDGDYIYSFEMPTGDVTIAATAVFNPLVTATFSGSDMAGMENAGTGYNTLKYITVNNFYWETNGYQDKNNNNVVYGMIQLRTRTHSSGASYIKLPDFPGKIETIVFSVTDASSSATTEGATTCSSKLYFQESPTSNGTIIAQGGGSATNSITISLTDKFYSTGYILANGGARIWNIDVTYKPYQDMTGNTLETIGNDVTVSIPTGANVTAENLTIPASSGIVINSGATLTVGTLTNSGNANNIIVKDGGQLIFYAVGTETREGNDVKATMEKNIAAWTTNPVGGWYFIASPINSSNLAPSSVTNMITADEIVEEETVHTFDLYKYVADNVVNEESKPWYNYRAHEGFVIANGQGYLYANASDKTLAFAGAVKPYSTTSNTVTLAKTGWNLIGNPFTCEVSVNKAFSELNNGSAVTNKDAGSTIMPCAGIAVNGTENDVVTFTMVEPQQSAAPSNPSLQLTLAQQATNRGNAATLDNAIVSFDEGNELPKFYFMQQNANLYIPQGTEEYAIVSTEAQGTMPVNFRANENGTYTLTVNPENVEMNYLHLIDNMTGADIDLLANPIYSFNATTTDYESRFKLVFASDASTGSASDETFAFYSNGNWIINNAGNATLQVVDLMGRILSSETVNGSVSKTINATPGVYMLRLINGENVKVQKVVIE